MQIILQYYFPSQGLAFTNFPDLVKNKKKSNSGAKITKFNKSRKVYVKLATNKQKNDRGF